MDEKDYELLHALDETRNITHAADKLYMTQSALSKRIKALEQELGVEIVLRSRQGIRFTPAGEQVLLHSAAAAREMEKMRRQLASIQGEACGTLRAGISVNFSYYRLPEVLTEYHRAYPKVRLDIATGHSRNIYQQMLDSSQATRHLKRTRRRKVWEPLQRALRFWKSWYPPAMCSVKASR